MNGVEEEEGENPGTASLPIRVFNAVSSPSFSAAKSLVDAATGWPPAPWGTSPVGSPPRPSRGDPPPLWGPWDQPCRRVLDPPPKKPNGSGEISLWSLRPVPDLLLSEPTQNGREPRKLTTSRFLQQFCVVRNKKGTYTESSRIRFMSPISFKGGWLSRRQG